MKRPTTTLVALLAISLAMISIPETALASSMNENDAKMEMKGSEHMKGSDKAQSTAGEMSPEMAAMMEKWQTYATPNENHKVLDKYVGNWDYNVEWKMGPDDQPQRSTGKSEVTWIIGDRFVQHKASGDPEASMQHPFEGLGIMGYDNLKKQYNSIWIDNMGTGMMQATGNYDQSAKIIKESGDFSCPMSGSKRSYRSVTTFIDPDKYTYETYTTDDDGKEFRSMIITYSRRKS